MRCPRCTVEVHPSWHHMRLADGGARLEDDVENDRRAYSVVYMVCPSCHRGLILVKESILAENAANPSEWYAVPRGSTPRPIPAEITGQIRADYEEAAAVLEISAKASAALSRRIIADLLERHAGQTAFSLSARIEGFEKDPVHPQRFKDNLRHLVEIGNFAAHTQKNSVTGEVVDVEPGEAEWALEVIDELFDHFIVGPARNEARRKAFDAKLTEAGRRPIPRTP
jgi:hypothetical protein